MLQLDIVVVGAAKAGTTTLERVLSSNNLAFRIAKRKPIFGMYIDKEEREKAFSQLVREGGKEGRREGGKEGRREGGKAFHVRADYMISEAAIKQISTETNAFVIMVCRDPVQRLWSHFYHDYRKGRQGTESGFDFYLKTARGKKAISLGEYGNCLQMMYRYLPKSRVKVVLTEDLSDIDKVNALLSELEMENVAFLPASQNVSRMPRWVRLVRLIDRLIQTLPKGFAKSLLIKFRSVVLTKDERRPSMKRSMRLRLKKIYLSDMELFEELSGRDLSGWRI